MAMEMGITMVMEIIVEIIIEIVAMEIFVEMEAVGKESMELMGATTEEGSGTKLEMAMASQVLVLEWEAQEMATEGLFLAQEASMPEILEELEKTALPDTNRATNSTAPLPIPEAPQTTNPQTTSKAKAQATAEPKTTPVDPTTDPTATPQQPKTAQPTSNQTTQSTPQQQTHSQAVEATPPQTTQRPSKAVGMLPEEATEAPQQREALLATEEFILARLRAISPEPKFPEGAEPSAPESSWRPLWSSLGT
jgi:septal ring-binding cell division protein DamX